MHGVDLEDSGAPIGLRVELPDQPVAVQDRQCVVAPPALRGRLVHLQDVVELEELAHPPAVGEEPVERREQRRAAVEGRSELGRVDPPRPAHTLDHGGLPRLAHVDGLGEDVVAFVVGESTLVLANLGDAPVALPAGAE